LAFSVLSESWNWFSIHLYSTPRPRACDGRAVNALLPALATGMEAGINLTGASIMGKYFLGWIMGVPVFVLVIIYILFN
jgi:hypothetical protein